MLPALRRTMFSRTISPCGGGGRSVRASSSGQDLKEALLAHLDRDSTFCGELVYSLSYASNDLEFHLEHDNTLPLIDDRMKRQLQHSFNALLSHNTENDAPKLRDRPHPQLKLGRTVYSQSFAGDSLESDLQSDNTLRLIDDRMKRQLQNSSLLAPSDDDARKLRARLPHQLNLSGVDTLATKTVERKLPPLVQDVSEVSYEFWAQPPLPKLSSQITPFQLDDNSRPIVITDTKNPFRIVAVNKAWESLCGYTRDECQGQSLGSLLQGPETETRDVSIMLSKLLNGEEAGAILTNYAKNGRKFKNHIRVGSIVDEMGKTANFVGVLREVKDEDIFSNICVGGGRMQLPFMS